MTEVPVPKPVAVIVRRFRCPFCNRSRAAKKTVQDHIARCWLNPATRACKTCAHFTSEPDGGYCLGTPCDCNRGYQQCEAGVSDVEDGKIQAQCPLWQAKEGGVP